MAAIRDYIGLIVPEYMPMGITGVLMGAIAATNTLPNDVLWLGIACFLCIIAGYNSYNAIIDKEIDIINKPSRPLPRKALTEKDALYVAAIFYIIAIMIALFLDKFFLLVALATIILTIAYSHPKIHLKRRFIIGTLTAVVLYTVLAPALGWALYSNNPVPVPIILFLFFLGIPKGILKDYVDIAGDSYHRVHSLPVQMGYLNSIVAVVLFYLVSAIFLGFAVYENILPFKFIFLLAFYPFMLWNVKTMSKTFDPHSRRDAVFIRAVLLLILIELAIIGLILI